MERRLFTELRSLYESSREKPKDIRIRIRMDENGITYDLQDVNRMELPNIKLPWSL